MKYYIIFNLIMQLFGLAMTIAYTIKFYPQIKKIANESIVKIMLSSFAIGLLIFIIDVSWSLYLIFTK